MKKLGSGLALITSVAMVMILVLPMGVFAQSAASGSGIADAAVSGSLAAQSETAGDNAAQDEEALGVSAQNSTGSDEKPAKNEAEITPFADVEYNVNDINVINSIISTNGLTWTPVSDPGNAAGTDFDDWDVKWSNTASNKRITSLNIQSKGLSGTLDVRTLASLTWLQCYGNQLTGLNVSGNTALTQLFCYGNQLTALDISTNTALAYFDCGNNQLTTLVVSANTDLKDLSFGSNKISTIDVSANTALEYLYCPFNELNTLDLSSNTALTELNCGDNQLTALDVSANTALKNFNCSSNQLDALDISANTALTELNCSSNQLNALTVSANTDLKNLNCGNNQLDALDVSNNIALTQLDCRTGALTSLDVSKNTALTGLWCQSNQLTLLDVSKNTALTGLACGANQLTALDVSKNTALTGLWCQSNQLTLLDVSKNTALTELVCSGNQLTSLDLSNCNPTTFNGTGQAVSLVMDGSGSSYTASVPMGAGASFGGNGGVALSYVGGVLTSTSKAAAAASFISPTGKPGKALSGSLSLVYCYWLGDLRAHTRDSGAGLTHVSPHDFSLHSGAVQVDGVTLAQGAHYTAAAGSTHITLLPAFLSTLSAGTHTLRVGFSGGTADVVSTFTVDSTPAPGSTSSGSASPKTGDEATPALYAALMLGAAFAAALCVVTLRRKQAAN